MTASNFSMTGAPSSRDHAWSQIDWQQAQSQVRRLQMCIAKAVGTQKWGKVKTLQWMLTLSYHVKLLAVKQVSQSSGAKTPGIDGLLWRTAEQKICTASSLQCLRLKSTTSAARLYSQKERQRPLGIPTLFDRAMQALHLLALEPVAETTAHKNSYGF
ncbi:MAG: reverse transcriptase N-terminal domain-containing protein [Granulosicoccus sp.]